VLGPGAGEICPETWIVVMAAYEGASVCTDMLYEIADAATEETDNSMIRVAASSIDFILLHRHSCRG
jgi:hypothetical protein